MAYVDGAACRLWVEVAGEGEPVTVFAHGITSSVAEVTPMAARVPGTRILFDFRGHGRSDSPPPESGYDVRGMREDLEVVADRYGATQAYGVSMGASAILSVVADRPDRFRRLAFFLPAAIDEAKDPATDHFFVRFAEMLETKPLAEVAEELLASPEYAPLLEARPRWGRLIRRRVLRMNATGVPRALRAFAAGSAPPVADAEALRRVTAPALIASHEGDPIHQAVVARRLAALLPNAELHIWPEPLAMLDDPHTFPNLLGRFLGGGGA